MMEGMRKKLSCECHHAFKCFRYENFTEKSSLVSRLYAILPYRREITTLELYGFGLALDIRFFLKGKLLRCQRFPYPHHLGEGASLL
jgi:hypothetical protein